MKRKVLIAAAVVFALAAMSLGACTWYGAGRGVDLPSEAPFAQQVIEYFDAYYYEDIDWSEFQYQLGAAIADGVDNFSGLYETGPVNASSKMIGATFTSNVYNEHFVSRLNANSPAETATPYQVFDYLNGVSYNGTLAEEMMGTVGLKRGDEIVGLKTSGDASGFTRVQNLESSVFSQYTSSLDTLDMQIYRYIYDENGKRKLAYELWFRIEKQVFHSDTARYIDGNDIGLGDGFGYISLSEFGDTAVDDFAAAAQAFADDPSSPTMLLLDLRGNGGGKSDILGFIASYFAADGSDSVPMARYVYNTGGGRDGETWFNTSRSIASVKEEGKTLTSFNFYQEIEGFKVAVLTDGNTASSSELLTWTIDFYSPDGVPTVGTTTYGKGVAQTVIRLANGKYELWITNGKYYLPLDIGGEVVWETSIHGVGISPSEENVVSTSKVFDYRYDPVIVRAAAALANN